MTENQAVRVAAGKDGVVNVSHMAARPTKFVRRMPVLKRIPIKLFNTGIHVAEGQPDPHWQVAVGGYDKKGTSSTPRPAIVSSVTGDIASSWLPNEPEKSQWISTVGNAARVPGDVIYTFSTTFELTGVRPETARLSGWFYVDNHVRAIRLNGREMRVPEHPTETSCSSIHLPSDRVLYPAGIRSSSRWRIVGGRIRIVNRTRWACAWNWKGLLGKRGERNLRQPQPTCRDRTAERRAERMTWT